MNIAGDEMQNDLDGEFCQILFMIKPYINGINDHYRLEKYRVWLEKLSNCNPSEKLERNKYLVELANQIHDDVLEPPFTLNPSRGPLPPLKKAEEPLTVRSPRHFQELEDIDVAWPHFTPSRSTRLEQPCQNLLTRRYGRSKERVNQIKKFVKVKTVARPFQALSKLREDSSARNSETSSWCDMSGSGTSVTVGFGDFEGVNEGQKVEEKNQTERAFSPSSTEEGVKNVVKERARKELEALKMRVEDLIEVKNALQETNVLSEDRKKTIDNLQSKVTLLENENSELKSLLNSQQKKYAEIEKANFKDLGDFKQRISSSRQKEVDKMKQQQQEQIKNLEKSHASKLSQVESEFKAKIETMKDDYEKNIKQLTDTHLEVLSEKEMEICRLRNELKNRGDSALNDQSAEQVVILKRCLSKLDKALQKTEKEYVIKIEKLKQELEIREMTAKMQLQTQRADLLLKGKTANQEEMKQAIEKLEQKYKVIIENIQFQAMEAKRHQEKQISELKSILEKHDIDY